MRAFVIAMESEAEAVRPAVRPEDILLVAGIGKVNAAAATQRAIDHGATEIINAGLAGGFPSDSSVPRATNHEPRATSHEPRATSHEPRATSHEPRTTNHEPRTTSHEPRATSHEPRATNHEPRTTNHEITVGGVYEVKSAVEYDFDLAKLNGTAVGVLQERDTPFIPLVTTGRFPAKILATGDHFNDKEDDYRLITVELGAGLRDMEGAAIAHVCEKAGIPCRALKCVTNVAGCGSMTGQYEENRARCLAILSEAVKSWLA